MTLTILSIATAFTPTRQQVSFQLSYHYFKFYLSQMSEIREIRGKLSAGDVSSIIQFTSNNVSGFPKFQNSHYWDIVQRL